MYIIVIGCGHIGSMVAKELANQNHNVVVIEREEERLKALGGGFNGMPILGIEYDYDNLLQAGIDKADVVLALTDDDNLNITVSLVAKQIFKVKRVIAEVIDLERRELYDQLDIETFSPVKMGVNTLLSRMDIVSIETVYKISSGFEVTQLHVSVDEPISVSDIRKQCNAVVSALITNGIGQLVDDKTLIKSDDVVLCTNHVRDRQRMVDLLVKE
jgi:trk system potassium uptake protein